jgi:hypothetical protein
MESMISASIFGGQIGEWEKRFWIGSIFIDQSHTDILELSRCVHTLLGAVSFETGLKPVINARGPSLSLRQLHLPLP